MGVEGAVFSAKVELYLASRGDVLRLISACSLFLSALLRYSPPLQVIATIPISTPYRLFRDQAVTRL